MQRIVAVREGFEPSPRVSVRPPVDGASFRINRLGFAPAQHCIGAHVKRGESVTSERHPPRLEPRLLRRPLDRVHRWPSAGHGGGWLACAGGWGWHYHRREDAHPAWQAMTALIVWVALAMIGVGVLVAWRKR